MTTPLFKNIPSFGPQHGEVSYRIFHRHYGKEIGQYVALEPLPLHEVAHRFIEAHAHARPLEGPLFCTDLDVLLDVVLVDGKVISP